MHCRNTEDKTAMDLAQDNGHDNIVAVLEETVEVTLIWLGVYRFVPCS